MASTEASCPTCGRPLAKDPRFRPAAPRRGLLVGLLGLGLVVAACAFVATGSGSWTGEDGEPSDAEAPSRPSAGDADLLAAIENSDDLELHRDAFLEGSRRFLMRGGTLEDLRQNGGWVRSHAYKPRRVYFTYKSPAVKRSDRWYLDVDSGRLFR